jgi:hypothetical protein
MTKATDAALLWTRTILAQFDHGIDWAQSDIDEFFRLTRNVQKELVATSIDMFAVILEETERLGANVYVSLGVPLPERDDLPLEVSTAEELTDLADFSGNLRGRSVPGFAIRRQNPTVWPSNPIEYRAVVTSSRDFARPVSTTLDLWRGHGDDAFNTHLTFASFADEAPLAESTYVTIQGPVPL